ncbi:MAG: hypothetical protein KGN36_22005 [Acidobacteriota bacterium]|nr:hypothetical protein [Acidobacteriota bacterium]
MVCATAGTARAMLRRDRGSIQVLVTNMPLEFAAHPDVPVLYLDAFPDPTIADAFVKSRVLAKPFHPRLLFESVAQLIG